MLFTTFYFSGTGNTRWVVEQFDSLVEENSIQAASYSIDRFDQFQKENLIDILKKSTYIGLAHPIYGANVPPIMKKFISLLIDIIKSEKIPIKPIYIINTFGYINALGPFQAKKLLDKHCFHLIAYCNIRLCNNISTHAHKAKLITGVKLTDRKKLAIVELKSLVSDILSNKKHMKGIGLYLLPGMIIRRKSAQSIQNHYHELSVQANSCSKCMLCVKKCPTDCISFFNDRFVFSSKCTACMRCYNFCPTASVLLNGVFTDPKEYFRYRGPE